MKVCYQVSTPEVYAVPGITSYQGDFETCINALIENGYDGVELMVRDPRQVDLRMIEDIICEHSLEVPMVCTGEVYGQDKLSFADPSDEIRTEAILRVKAAIDLAMVFGKQINIGRVRGGYIPGVEWAVTYKRIFEGFKEIVGYAEKRDVIVALEPVNTLGLNYINSTLEGLEFVKKVDSPCFRLMLDTAHMHIEDRNIGESITKSKEYVTFVHLADSNRRYLGAGIFDFPVFLTLLKKSGYDGYLGVEVFPLPDQDTALTKSIHYLRPILDLIEKI